MQQLSEHFNLSEFIESHIARQEGFAEQFQPSDITIDNIERLVINLLEPIRQMLPDGYIKVTSGYRCRRLNDYKGSKDTSQHLRGQAADIEYYENNIENNSKLWDTIINSKLSFDQLIDEKNKSWIHVSYINEVENRNQILKLG